MGLPVTQTASRYRFFSGQLLAGLLSVIALAAGCGGGGSGGGGGAGLTQSGTAQKGRFTDLHLRVLPVDSRTAELGNPRDAEIDDQNYVVTVPENPLTVLGMPTGTWAIPPLQDELCQIQGATPKSSFIGKVGQGEVREYFMQPPGLAACSFVD